MHPTEIERVWGVQIFAYHKDNGYIDKKKAQIGGSIALMCRSCVSMSNASVSVLNKKLVLWTNKLLLFDYKCVARRGLGRVLLCRQYTVITMVDT